MNIPSETALAGKLKRISLFIVLGVLLYQGKRLSEENECYGLLRDGHYSTAGIWQPYGCTMHYYASGDLRRCLQDRLVVFLGDSRVREIYHALCRRVRRTLQTQNLATIYDEARFPKHSNLTCDLSSGSLPKFSLKLKFIWMPFANKSMSQLLQGWKDQAIKADIIVVSAGLWRLRDNPSERSQYQYGADTAYIIEQLSEMVQERTDIFWLMQAPVIESKLNRHRKNITNKIIASYNAELRAVWPPVAPKGLHRVEAVIPLVSAGQSGNDGLHFNETVSETLVEMILNVYGNKQLLPPNGTCCVPSHVPSLLQIITGLLLLLCAVFYMVLRYISRKVHHRQSAGLHDLSASSPGSSVGAEVSFSVGRYHITSGRMAVFQALAQLAAIMLFFYMADRTIIFMKENKVFSWIGFILPCFLFLIIGLITCKPVKKGGVMNRDQTDETRGWMQLLILVYHYTGASKVLPIYFVIRLLVAGYLFLSGFGHFTYFWSRNNFSPSRAFQVLFRINLLTVLLCLVMARPYQHYYFVPLVSVWYAIIHFTVAVGYQRASHLGYVVIIVKLLVLFLLCALFWWKPSLLLPAVSWWPVRELFVDMSGSLKEWQFRFHLDSFAAPCGMVWGLLLAVLPPHLLAEGQLLSINKPVNKRPVFSFLTKHVPFFASLFSMVAYTWALCTLCHGKVHCNRLHTWLSPIPGFLLGCHTLDAFDLIDTSSF